MLTKSGPCLTTCFTTAGSYNSHEMGASIKSIHFNSHFLTETGKKCSRPIKNIMNHSHVPLSVVMWPLVRQVSFMTSCGVPWSHDWDWFIVFWGVGRLAFFASFWKKMSIKINGFAYDHSRYLPESPAQWDCQHLLHVSWLILLWLSH